MYPEHQETAAGGVGLGPSSRSGGELHLHAACLNPPTSCKTTSASLLLGKCIKNSVSHRHIKYFKLKSDPKINDHQISPSHAVSRQKPRKKPTLLTPKSRDSECFFSLPSIFFKETTRIAAFQWEKKMFKLRHLPAKAKNAVPRSSRAPSDYSIERGKALARFKLQVHARERSVKNRGGEQSGVAGVGAGGSPECAGRRGGPEVPSERRESPCRGRGRHSGVRSAQVASSSKPAEWEGSQVEHLVTSRWDGPRVRVGGRGRGAGTTLQYKQFGFSISRD